MNDRNDRLSRSDVLKSLAALPALGLALGASTREADAQASKAPQSAVKYQNHPQNGQECDQCTFFLPGKSKTANGGCKVVQGSISPKGWCVSYAKKS